MTVTGVLASWNDGATRRAVVEFAERTVSAGIPPAERVAVFDNDGTLWCEKPMPIQADFILRRLYEMAQDDPGLRGRQPWKAAYERDYGWLATVLAEHYAGNDTNVRTLLAGVLAAYDGISVEDFEAKSDALRLMQNLLLLASGSLPEMCRSSRHAVSDNRQRLLRTIERRFPTPNLSRRRSRCDSIVCQDWMLSNLTTWNIAWADCSKNHGIGEKGDRAS
jgi:hypothetical protein